MAMLSPLDLLTVTNTEQDIIRCLIRKPCLTLQEIAGLTRIPVDELESVVYKLVRESRLNVDSDRKYQVQMQSKPKHERSSSGLLDTLFN
jgi:hypothetical protein